MNESPDSQKVSLTAEWEFVEHVPDDFDLAIPAWLDVTGTCGGSNLDVRNGEKIFNATMAPEWTPTFSGDLFTVHNHLHDGGARQELYMDDKVICNSTAGYGETEDFIAPMGGSHAHGDSNDGSGHGGMMRISSLSSCDNVAKIGPDNKLTITAYYDMNQHPGMPDHHNGMEPVMGIALLHVAREQKEALKSIRESNPPDYLDLIWHALGGN